MPEIFKFPRTRHLEGSETQPGDAGDTVSFRELAGRYLVVTEKMDGANCGISFSPDGSLRLQSRGHYLTGGGRERQFELFKSWASRYTADLWTALSDQYILYGEWLYAKHSIFYTDLPHYFLAFDILDTANQVFLDTARRRALLAALPSVASVNVLHTGPVASLAHVNALIGPSPYIAPDHLAQLQAAALERGLDPGLALRETDPSRLMEGLYIKVEEGGMVTTRCKLVRPQFRQMVTASQSHWASRPLLPNRLRSGVELFAG